MEAVVSVVEDETVVAVAVAARHLLEAHLLRRDQVGVVVLPRRAHVRQLLRLADVHLEVAGARVDPDDLVGVHRVVGACSGRRSGKQ